MEELLINLSSLSWWISTVVIAVLASLFAGFLQNWIPKWITKLSKSARKRSYKRKRIVVTATRIYMDNSQLHISAIHRYNRSFLMMVLTLLLTMLMGPLHLFFETFPIYDPLGLLMPKVSGLSVGLLPLSLIFLLAPMFFSIGSNARMLNITHCRLRVHAKRGCKYTKANKKINKDT
ncbi:hypothetical protein [Pseudoalteromonas aliena]|uniref:hypothetical protein n=1 Tax=Pseudoalteromonas aliena TaxID=247523 RepID=UPI0024956AC5|nr:hypothetical protein [Pseudoalteromonas aliena]